MAETTISIERLRKLLDQRGVGYRTESFPELTLPFESIKWRADGMLCKFSALLESGLTQLELTHCTPERAIAATLGRGECERVKRGVKPDGTPRYRCSVCGYGLGDCRWAYCPKCGSEIKGGAE